MEDRLSSLPEELLCHILCFVPPKQAVATSVLSKKWKSLWRSLPALDFEGLNYTGRRQEYDQFVQSVYAVILSRDLHQPIQKFRLHCPLSRYYDQANANIWINAVAQRGVQHLDIFLQQTRYITPAIFTCKTLVVLKLQQIRLGPLSSFDLPVLKVLHLQQVINCECLPELLSGCPVLEDFKEWSLGIAGHVTLKEIKPLTKLVRAEFSTKHNCMLMKVVKNVEFLHLDAVPFGSDLPCEGQGTDPYFIPMFHNLTRLELTFKLTKDKWYSPLVEFLKFCSKLQVLVINQPHCYRAQIEEGVDWKYPPSVPECILLHLKNCYLNNYRGTKVSLNLQDMFSRMEHF